MTGMDWKRQKERSKAAGEREHADNGRSRRDPMKKALDRLRYGMTDALVNAACELAAEGGSVVYASDWSPGSANEDRLRAAGVDLHTALRTKR